MAGKPFTTTGMIDELRKCGVTHIVWNPDSELKDMYDVLKNQNDIAAIPVCREGEAIPLAYGLFLGGKKPVVIHQNTGLFESGESIRDFAVDHPFALLMLVSLHGWGRPGHPNNSCATFTFPILDTWGIKHYLVETEEDIQKVSAAYIEAQETGKMITIVFRRGVEKP